MPPRSLSRQARVLTGALCLATLAGCDSTVAPDLSSAGEPAFARNGTVPVRPQPPTLEVRSPTYPTVAVYIVYREFVHRNPGLTELDPEDRRFLHYMEKRLRELYPQRGYAGMMQDAVAEARRNRALWQQYERDVREYERRMAAHDGTLAGASMTAQCTAGSVDLNAGADVSWSGTEEHPHPVNYLPTVQAEIDSLRLVGPEIDDILYFDALAAGTYAPPPGSGGGGGGPWDNPIHMEGIGPDPTIDDYIRAAGEGRTPYNGEMSAQVNPVAIATIALAVIGGGYEAFRARQAGVRAKQMGEFYYPNLGGVDDQQDAFRHIYLSVLLRRYVGSFYAKAITDQYEAAGAANGDNTPPATVMDYHNNDIGRVHRYKRFRGHWLWDRWDEGAWAHRVRVFINDVATNGEYIPEWRAVPTPTLAEAWARESCVPKTNYIFFRP